MPAAQFEIASPPLRDADHAAEFLRTARADLTKAANGLAKLACAGVHPFADEEGELNAGERYKRVHAEYGGIARRQLAFGLQVSRFTARKVFKKDGQGLFHFAEQVVIYFTAP